MEFRTAGLALAALQLDKIELAGRSLNIGRPKGYVEPPQIEERARLSAAQQFAAQVCSCGVVLAIGVGVGAHCLRGAVSKMPISQVSSQVSSQVIAIIINVTLAAAGGRGWAARASTTQVSA